MIKMTWILQMVYLITILATARAHACDACIEGHCYEMHLLRPPNCPISFGSDVKVERRTSTIYYRGYQNGESNIVCAYHLNDNTTEIIPMSSNRYTKFTTDQKTGVVYAKPEVTLPSNGIHKYDPMTNSTEAILTNVAMAYIYFKDKLYYTNSSMYETKGLHPFENDSVVDIPALEKIVLLDFVVNKNDDIYFQNRYKGNGRIYVLKKNAQEAIVVSKIPRYSYISTDKDNNVVLFTSPRKTSMTELYKIIEDEPVLIGVFDFRVITNRLNYDGDHNIILWGGKRGRFIITQYHLRRNDLRCTFTKNSTAALITVEGTSVDTESRNATTTG